MGKKEIVDHTLKFHNSPSVVHEFQTMLSDHIAKEVDAEIIADYNRSLYVRNGKRTKFFFDRIHKEKSKGHMK